MSSMRKQKLPKREPEERSAKIHSDWDDQIVHVGGKITLREERVCKKREENSSSCQCKNYLLESLLRDLASRAVWASIRKPSHHQGWMRSSCLSSIMDDPELQCSLLVGWPNPSSSLSFCLLPFIFSFLGFGELVIAGVTLGSLLVMEVVVWVPKLQGIAYHVKWPSQKN